MKEGRSIGELAAEIQRQSDVKRDFIAPTNKVEVIVADVLNKVAVPKLSFPTNGESEVFGIMPHAHRQIGQHLEIPAKYYDKMLAEAPELLANNLNHWLHEESKARMLRTLDGNVRAFLSDRYRPLDNIDLAETVLPILGEFNMQVRSCQVTDTKLYIKATRPDLQTEIKGSRQVGDVVEAGIVISNSEVGSGSLAIQPLLYRLVCSNGMISNDHALKKFHTGGRKSKDDVAYEILRDATKAQHDKAFWMSVQDLTRSALDGVVFQEQVKAVEQAAGHKIESAKLDKVVEVASKRLSLNEGESDSVLKHLIEGGDLSKWGLCNAITRASQDVDDYDRATELEKAGGEVIELSKNDWKDISEAA